MTTPAKKYYLKNREKILAAHKKWASENLEKRRIQARRWAAKNREKLLSAALKWQKKHPERARAACAAYEAQKIKAMPEWANRFFIEEIYDLAKRRTALKTGGHSWHVDHIVPLRAKNVCGLHVEHNLQVIPDKANIAKGNKTWPDMP